jgi:hypothetical protein
LHLLDVKDRVDGRNEGGIWSVVGFLLAPSRVGWSMRIPLIPPSQAVSKSSCLAPFAGLRVQLSTAPWGGGRNLTRCCNTG